MKIEEVLKIARARLGEIREAYYLLSAFLKKDFSYILCHGEEELEGSPAELLRWIEMRSRGMPLAYLSHLKEFYGRPFYLDRRVLVPRPETEILVEEALKLAKELWDGKLTAVDVGTGSGCLAVSLALELPHCNVLAVDLSPDALEVAQRNAHLHNVEGRIQFLEGDLLSPVVEPQEMILANLPYVPEELLSSSPSLQWEPASSLKGGRTGGETILRLLKEAPSRLKVPGVLLLEIGEGEGELLQEAGRAFPDGKVALICDLQGLPRALEVLRGA